MDAAYCIFLCLLVKLLEVAHIFHNFDIDADFFLHLAMDCFCESFSLTDSPTGHPVFA